CEARIVGAGAERSSMLRGLKRVALSAYATLFRSRPATPGSAGWSPACPRNSRCRCGSRQRRCSTRSARDRRKRPKCAPRPRGRRSEEHTSELQSREDLVCRLLLEKKKDRIVRQGG